MLLESRLVYQDSSMVQAPQHRAELQNQFQFLPDRCSYPSL